MRQDLQPAERLMAYCTSCGKKVPHVVDYSRQSGNFAPLVCEKHEPGVLDREDDNPFPLHIFSPDEVFALNRVRLSKAVDGDNYRAASSHLSAEDFAGTLPNLVIASQLPGEIPC